MKHILILQRNNELETWGSLTALCKAHGLPYHSLKVKRFPIQFGGELTKDEITPYGRIREWTIHKVPYNTKTIYK